MASPAKAGLALPEDPAARAAALVLVLAHWEVHLLARTNWSRRPFRALATISSDFPGVHIGRVDEVHACIQRAIMMRIEASWSGFPHSPNIIAPRNRRLTFTPVRPRVRYSTPLTIDNVATRLRNQSRYTSAQATYRHLRSRRSCPAGARPESTLSPPPPPPPPPLLKRPGMGKVLQRRVIAAALTLSGAAIVFVLFVPIASGGNPGGKD